MVERLTGNSDDCGESGDRSNSGDSSNRGEMAQVYLNIGSNIERHAHICAGLDALQRQFGPLELSSVYESTALGFSGDAFFNLAVALNSAMGVAELAGWLRQLEFDKGRHGINRARTCGGTARMCGRC